MLLCATYGPDTRRHRLNGGKNACEPFRFDRTGICVRFHTRDGAIYGKSYIADTKQYPTRLQIADTDRHRTDARYFEIIGPCLPVWVSGSRRRCTRVIDLEHLPKFVFCPQVIAHRVGDRLMAEDDDYAAILFRRSGAGIGQ